jgi:hypothetical protein
VGPVFGISAERPLAGGRGVTSFAARTPLVENRDRLRVRASSELSAAWAHTVRTHKVIADGCVDWLHRQHTYHGTPVLVGGGDWLDRRPAWP